MDKMSSSRRRSKRFVAQPAAMPFLLLLLCVCVCVSIGACVAQPSKAVVTAAAAAAAVSDETATVAATTIKTTKETRKSVNSEFPEEDTDMLMEPNDFGSFSVLRSLERHFQSPPTTQNFQHHHHQQQQQSFLNTPIARSDIRAPPPQDSHSQAAQNFYPPFFREAPPLGHSRPYFPTPDGPPPIPKFAVARPEILGSVPVQGNTANGAPSSQRNFDASLLGSGDFGVLRGGTFYPEEEMPYHQEDNSDFDPYYGDANNGHGRPSSDGLIQAYTYPEEQFADFRDFADINTPADSAFSQFVVVYAAKNATRPGTPPHPRPKNIFEQLEALDREKALEEAQAKKQRPSKAKSKLGKTKLLKKYQKAAGPKEADYEPLIALS